jgi:hypothetical protein
MSGEQASAEITTSELSAGLDRALRDRLGSQRRVIGLERRPSPFRTSFPLEELDVELEDGARLRLVLKDLSRAMLSDRARKAKPDFLSDPLREIETYRDLLEPAGLGTAAYFGSDVDPSRERYWLFIENVSGPALWQVGELPVWEEAARWLAAMHDHFADRGRLPGRLVSYDAAFYRLWPERAREFAKRDGRGRSRQVDWLASRHDQVVEHLTALRSSFIHGEFYASNVLVSGGTGSTRICPVDWEMAGVGPGMLDLAALTTGWSDAERRSLALAYRETSESPPAPADDLLRTLDYCHLHLAVRWLGWSPDWRPPRAHRRDWLGEAVRTAEKLGL